MFREAATNGDTTDLEECTSSVTSYINKCIDDVTISKSITTRSNQKPWMTAKVCALLKSRASAFRARDKDAPRTAWAKLSQAIREAKPTHSQRIHSHFQSSGDTRRMWQGIQSITNYRPAPPACDSDASFPDALNSFYTRFEAQNDVTARKTIPPQRTRGTIESILSSCTTAWFGNCTVSDRKTLQRIVRSAEKVIGVSLPFIMDIYSTRCIRKANSIVDNPTPLKYTLHPPAIWKESNLGFSSNLRAEYSLLIISNIVIYHHHDLLVWNAVVVHDLKAYDRVPREELWYCMRKSGVAEKNVRVVQDMYERSRTVVKCAVVMDQLSEEVRQESPWTMMFADDIVICSESREQVEENLERHFQTSTGMSSGPTAFSSSSKPS
ncbi:hypothetical protein QTP70_029327 [Hemibagrus guttatus]|uniref:Reverse transcriptase domain-containing protein n=1 Tax=Hemibagrus guttatus TaxID=175788 RepID=A0AAE0V0V7_9TELE|nr:hypothetical protein QTP70_029327 [Hemibagrus guttatus]